MSDPNVCFVDTETTGLDPERHEIWEVGLIMPDGRQLLWQLPVDLGRADAYALKVGRFYERRHADLTPADEFAEWFSDLTAGLHLAGAVVSFDEERLRKLLRANGACPRWHYHLIDVENLAAGKLGRRPPWDSRELAAELGIVQSEDDEHTALGDARWAKAIYENVVGVA